MAVSAVIGLTLTVGLAIKSSSAAEPSVTEADLTAAGFTGVEAQAPSGSSFQPPTMYFRVKESVAATNPEWGDAANLVAALVFPMNYQTSFSLSEPRVRDFAGRSDICMTKPGFYICVVGPDAGKGRALLDILLKK